jgi:hypothetical protein
MKKTWIKIKHGLLEPKHREQMGSAIWLAHNCEVW